ncbi:hypothetical protein D3C87_2193490 [compost metagenome]
MKRSPRAFFTSISESLRVRRWKMSASVSQSSTRWAVSWYISSRLPQTKTSNLL